MLELNSVDAHVEELRAQLVRHNKKKTVKVTAQGSRYTVDFGVLSKGMTSVIHNYVCINPQFYIPLAHPLQIIDDELKDWVLLDFSTTIDYDTVICTVLMISTMKGSA